MAFGRGLRVRHPVHHGCVSVRASPRCCHSTAVKTAVHLSVSSSRPGTAVAVGRCGRCGMIANTLKRDVFADDFPLVPGLEVSERPGGLTLQVALGDVNPEDVSVAAE